MTFPWAHNPLILTPRLRLEPLLAEHASALYPLLSDPLAQQWIGPLTSPTVEALRVRWSALEGRRSPDGQETLLAWAVCRQEDGAWLGKLDANVAHTGIATNLGYVFAPAAWGHGYATEAVGAVVGQLLETGVTELRACVTVGNEASARVLERCGFVRAGILPNNDVIRGVPHDDMLFVRR